jgi:GntR family transcriptional regulator
VPKPPYRIVVDEITTLIASGEWREGEPIPSRVQLVDQFGLSATTVERVVDILEDRRLIVGRQGKARFVAEGARGRAAQRLVEDGAERDEDDGH